MLAEFSTTLGLESKYGVTDVLRPEHLWLVVACETGRAVTRTMAPDARDRVLARITDTLLHHLRHLSTYYRTLLGSERAELQEAAATAMVMSGMQFVPDDEASTAMTAVSVWEEEMSAEETKKQSDVWIEKWMGAKVHALFLHLHLFVYLHLFLYKVYLRTCMARTWSPAKGVLT